MIRGIEATDRDNSRRSVSARNFFNLIFAFDLRDIDFRVLPK